MNCGCIRGEEFLFVIKDISCEVIIYEDLSTWMDDDGCEIPPTYEIGIYNSEGKKQATVEVSTSMSTLLEQSIPDGIYEIRTEICGVKYSRTAAIIPSLKCCIDRYLIKPDLEKDKVCELISLLAEIEAAAKFNMTDLADYKYTKAKQLTKLLKCNC